MKFIKKVLNNIYSPDYYNSVQNESFGKSFKYFLLLLIIPAIFGTILFVSFFGNLLNPKIINKEIEKVANVYPADLVLTIKSGQLSTNYNKPYIVSFNDLSSTTISESKVDSSEIPSNFLVVDTNVAPSVEKFTEYDTLILATKDYLIYREDGGSVSVESLKNMPDAVLDQKAVTDLSNKISKFAPYILPILAVFLLIVGYIMLIIGNLVFITVFSFFVLIIQRIIRNKISYSSLYKVGLHAITLPIILEIIFDLIGVTSVSFIISILVFISVVMINTNKSKK